MTIVIILKHRGYNQAAARYILSEKHTAWNGLYTAVTFTAAAKMKPFGLRNHEHNTKILPHSRPLSNSSKLPSLADLTKHAYHAFLPRASPGVASTCAGACLV